MSFFRPIHHTFAPLADRAQRRLALSLLLSSRKRTGTAAREQLRSEFGRRLNGSTFLFASGREALFAFLSSCAFAKGDEIIVQAFTCTVVPNAITAAGLTPIYADIEKETLNLDSEDVLRRITPRTRAIICQHTFGIPAPVDRLREICDQHHLLLIEDCAHVLPDRVGPMEVTSRGDALLLSFGRDKAVSGVSGGAIVCRKPDISQRLALLEKNATPLSESTIRRLLLYPLVYGFARPLYGSGIGKLFLAFARSAGLLLPIVTEGEKHGMQEKTLHEMPEACAILALQQCTKLAAINEHRRTLTRFYLEACATHGWPVLHGIASNLPLQKFPLFIQNAEKIRRELKRSNIHLSDGWTGCVVCPASTDLACVGYAKGRDPIAEEASLQILSFPTHPGTTKADAARLVKAVSMRI